MAAIAVEKFDSRRYKERLDGSSSTEIVYDIRGTDDEAEALTALKAAAPLSLGLVPVIGYSRNRIGPGRFEGIAEYEVQLGGSKLPPAATLRYSFDTTGETQKITQAPTVAIFDPDGDTAPDYGDLIEVELDDAGKFSNVAGCTITIPTFKWQEATVYHFTGSSQFDDFKVTLKGLTGKTNSGAFRGFEEGEVLFLGATGTGNRRQNADASFDLEITLHFAQSDNLAGETIAGVSGVGKGGWDYLWVNFKRDPADPTHPKVLGVYVNRVYQAGDFSALDI